MAAVDASAQEVSSSMPRCTYHAFLSFRGEDTRNNFTSHLYGALMQAGIHTFLDDDGIERGENIEAELQKAIKESMISIIVFSKDYASSRWCLDELVMIMERRRTDRHIVVPVFYDVDPSQVRKQTGSFSDAFARHEQRFKEEVDRIERWRAALKEVADLAGEVLGYRCEWQFIQNIVQKIGNKLNQPLLNVPTYLVGLDSHIKNINLWVQDGSNDVGIAMIYGIGGIGKTTIAKIVYNMNYDRFEGRSFLGNVGETTKQPNGLVGLQGKLLLDILKRKTSKIQHLDEGIIKIKDAICCKRVLLVLDDVDQLDQLNAIVGMREWFYPGSKIIITTRHERLEGFNEVCKKFKVEQMNDGESLLLFSWHAFRQDLPIEGYMEWSRKAVHHCGGLPLALEVLGSSLYSKETNFWESALQKLETIPLALQVHDGKVQNVIKISYDSLQRDHRDLFLNIACFFIRKDKDYTVAILDRHDFCTTVGIQNLIDRCLLTITEDKKLMMHRLLRDMGREIVRQESPIYPGKRSRLWHHEDAFTVLKEKTGTETVEGLTLNLRSMIKDKRGTKRRHDEHYLDKNSSSLSNEVYVETETFVMMHELKLLQLNYVSLRGNYKDFPKNLMWLCWHGFPLESIPTEFYLEKLVALDMRYSNLKHVWRGTKFLTALKILNLNHSHRLIRTPDFSGLPSLERLMLKDCIKLVTVDESIGNLGLLVLLDLEDCKKLRKLPRNIQMLKSLEKLNLSGCSKLDEVPPELRELKLLKVLHLDRVSLNQFHATTSDTDKYKWLSSMISWGSTLWSKTPHSTNFSWNLSLWSKTPHSTSFSWAFLPQFLTELSLQNCNLSDDATSCLIILPCLQHLDLSRNPFRSLPESIKRLTMLKKLDLVFCEKLEWLPEFASSLRFVELEGCSSLERISNPSFNWIPDYNFCHCINLDEVEGVFKFELIENVDVAVLESLGLSNLESFRNYGGSNGVIFHNIFVIKKVESLVKALHEGGVLSIFLPQNEIPSCFKFQRTGSFISLDVPPLAGRRIRGLNLCILYNDSETIGYISGIGRVVIINKTKRMRWTYAPLFIPMFIPMPFSKLEGKDILWLIHWEIGDQLEGGDEIDVSILFNEWAVKMCGICFMYEPEDKGTQSNTKETVRSTFPWYHTITLTKAGVNAYFRCHHSYNCLLLATSVHERTGVFGQNPQLELDTCLLCEGFHDFDEEPFDWEIPIIY